MILSRHDSVRLGCGFPVRSLFSCHRIFLPVSSSGAASPRIRRFAPRFLFVIFRAFLWPFSSCSLGFVLIRVARQVGHLLCCSGSFVVALLWLRFSALYYYPPNCSRAAKKFGG